MIPTQLELIRLLSDGHFHSGEALGVALKMTRASIWKLIEQLTKRGIEIRRVKGKGYQIPNGLDLFHADQLKQHLSPATWQQITLEILTEVNSTNQYLKDKRPRNASGTVVLAEYQTGGRGRRQRTWVSPFGSNLCLSFFWNLDLAPSQLSGLSLATGIAVTNALERYGIHHLQLKWPNDVLWHHQKLSGVLLEISGEISSTIDLVIGVGMNIRLPPTYCQDGWVDVATIIGKKPNRHQIAAFLIEEIVAMITLYQQKGFAPFYKHWQALDAFFNQPVVLSTPTQLFKGIAKGINPQGELMLLNDEGQVLCFAQGEVSLRRLTCPVN
jgi:BirA family biotin operon repressor/biotin-[acetyl-CoA-carboxylase] ligase